MTSTSEDEILNKITAIFDRYSDLNDLNAFLSTKTGIRDFFHSKRSLEEFRKFLTESHSIKYGSKDLGDFQTQSHLTDKTLYSESVNTLSNLIKWQSVVIPFLAPYI